MSHPRSVGALAVLLLAAPAVRAEPPVQGAVWLNLAPTIAVLATTDGRDLHLSAGAQLVLNRSLSVAVELAGHLGGPYAYECAASSSGAWLAAGAMWRPLGATSGGAARGLFVQGRLVGHVAKALGPTSTAPECSPGVPYPEFVQFDVGAGASIGWETVVAEHLSLGSALGASIGLGRTTATLLRVAATPSFDVVWQFDFSLLRLGFAW